MRLILVTLMAAIPVVAQPQRPGARPGAGQLPEGVQVRSDIAYDERSEAQELDLYLPPEADGGLRPAIVVVHGGGWRSGDKQGGQWSRIPAEYASRGYVAISVNYRLSGEAPWPAQVEDVKAAVRWLRAHGGDLRVDAQRIGAYGNSAGAHLVSLLGLVRAEDGLEGTGPNQDHSSVVQAVCASATPTDFLNWGAEGRLPQRLGGTFLAGPPETLADRAKQASPITYARKGAPPFLLIHGTADRTVPIQQSDRFAKALRDAGAEEVRYMIFDEEGHGVFRSQQLLTYPAMKAFFDKALSPE
ncbi:MAG: alpha/beta hydrolase [Bryobacterales bacterium]|nr:alpha/beta hydrolase [Bryobacterales bacterium]